MCLDMRGRGKLTVVTPRKNHHPRDTAQHQRFAIGAHIAHQKTRPRGRALPGQPIFSVRRMGISPATTMWKFTNLKGGFDGILMNFMDMMGISRKYHRIIGIYCIEVRVTQSSASNWAFCWHLKHRDFLELTTWETQFVAPAGSPWSMDSRSFLAPSMLGKCWENVPIFVKSHDLAGFSPVPLP